MHEYRLKQPKNRLDCLESVFFAVFGLGLILMERRIALGLTLFAFAAWSLWRDFYSGLNLNQYGVASPCRTICTVCGFVALS